MIKYHTFTLSLSKLYLIVSLLSSTKILFLVRTSTYTLSPYLSITSDHFCPRLSGIRPIKRSSAKRRSNHEITNFCLPFPSSIPPFPSSAHVSFVPRLCSSSFFWKISPVFKDRGLRSTRKTASDKQRRGTVYAYREEY